MNNKKIILVRGLPGSGKSTLAHQLSFSPKYYPLANNVMDWSCRIKEADKFFTWDTGYHWNGEFIRHAHQWCLAETIRHLFIIGDNLAIISNTFTRISEMQPYMDLAKQHDLQLEVVEPTTSWAKDPEECFRRNTHNVPLETIQKMLNRWEIIK